MTKVNQNIIDAINQTGIITIVRGVKNKDLLGVLGALSVAGIKLAEITFGKYSDEQTFEDLKLAKQKYGDKLFIGAGTVTTKKRMQLALEAGCEYLVSPVLNQELIDFCKQNNLISIVGALTPSEIKTAHDQGANFVKVFPSSAFGPGYFKELKAPLGEVNLIAFGGITLVNAPEFIASGAVAIGAGSAVINHELISKGDFGGVFELAKKMVKAVNKEKQKLAKK